MAEQISEIPALKEWGAPLGIEVPENERARVLVVDDNPALLESFAAVVSNMGVEAVTATSGRDALRQLLRRDFALILLDVHMPTMDGFETAHLIRSRPRSAHTPIVFVTAAAYSEAERLKGYAAGAADFIFSPVAPEILRAKIRVFVELYYLNRLLRQQAAELGSRAEEIARKSLQVEEASRMKSEFLANMSHELRTPLNAIIGFAEILKDGLGGELNAKQREFIGDIYASGVHLLALINDILDLSKVEAGKTSLELEPTDVAALVQASLGVVREKALKHRIQLKLEIPPDMGSVVADARKVKQMIYNLLSNALKFTPDGGEVRLKLRAVKRADVKIVSPDGLAARVVPLPESAFEDFIEIAVCDTGIGIEEADLRRLFQAFMQVDSSLAREYEGTGLGLSLVRRFATLHGGTVGVASAPKLGSCFAIWLPWRRDTDEAQAAEAAPAAPVQAAPATAVKASTPAAGAARPLALVIEDDDRAAEILRLLLESEGFRVARAASAEQGLALAAKERPALITLDILLPCMDGWEALERIKRDPALAGVPVVIASVLEDPRRGYALGASRVLQKPVGRKELLATLAELELRPDAGGKFTVLVVDDDPKAVALVAAHLKTTQCKVVRAYGGRAAIKAAHRILPDLVILDLIMPNISGFEVVEALKSRPETARVPIVILTAKTVTPEDRKRLNGYVEKVIEKTPFDQDGFLTEVQRALRKKIR